MKFKHLILMMTALVLIAACASTKNEKKIITGEFTWNQWQKQAGWDKYDAADYEPGEFLAGQLSEIVKNNDISFLLFSASWCGDSKSEVPKIYKLFDTAKIPIDRIKLFGVDRQKLEPTGTAEKYKIERVPTLVILRDGKEIGRIIEHPKTSWEEDIFKIITKQ